MNDKTATEKIIKAIDILERQEIMICHNCAHPAMVGWCENHCGLPEAFDMAIEALKVLDNNAKCVNGWKRRMNK